MASGLRISYHVGDVSKGFKRIICREGFAPSGLTWMPVDVAAFTPRHPMPRCVRFVRPLDVTNVRTGSGQLLVGLRRTNTCNGSLQLCACTNTFWMGHDPLNLPKAEKGDVAKKPFFRWAPTREIATNQRETDCEQGAKNHFRHELKIQIWPPLGSGEAEPT